VRVVFPFARQGARFEASGPDVDGTGGDGVEQAFVVDRQRPSGRGRHVLREPHGRAGGVQQTDPGGLGVVLLGRGNHHPPHPADAGLSHSLPHTSGHASNGRFVVITRLVRAVGPASSVLNRSE